MAFKILDVIVYQSEPLQAASVGNNGGHWLLYRKAVRQIHLLSLFNSVLFVQ